MGFQTGLSGLNASSKNLDVIGNNIANANTVGMKTSRAEFANLVAATLGASGSSSTEGIGVTVGTTSQQFTQGNLNITGNTLDVAINGRGFFQTTERDGSTAYTRDGQFKLDKDGNVITNTGGFVMAYPTDVKGKTTSLTPQKLTLPTAAPIPAKATTTINTEMNLDARAEIDTSPAPPETIARYGTTITAFDSQGQEVPVSLYFVKSANDTWNVYDSLNATTPAFNMTFDANGQLTSPTGPMPLTVQSPNPNIGAFTVNVDVSKATQYGAPYAVSNLSQDGYTAGELTGMSIDESGVIMTRYSNGQSQGHGQLAIADFRNVQGLRQGSGGIYFETFSSGQPMLGQPGIGKYGQVRSGALEESNVDLTAELVNMMTAQRNYQANAQTIKTQDQIMSTLVNIR
ncbi:flagellar hook protein FlgE [Curvibacter sp. CHRR-16]|uniref:flagellar hook protein FlgE n=1 Tax=Curvibacter sp. CHRR-16 TaxID=2835872 RepID=UPI001BD9181E|nr:flagellar hook protein FlgE [Curvibacter sp. CHRR-16]MBT0569549.1 flagellar hook protein FlgE [Curvibacter sp. CHRR-16]